MLLRIGAEELKGFDETSEKIKDDYDAKLDDTYYGYDAKLYDTNLGILMRSMQINNDGPPTVWWHSK